MTHVFVWTFKDVIGATILGILAVGGMVYGALVLYEKARRSMKKLRGGE